jgi:hypothetical protein
MLRGLVLGAIAFGAVFALERQFVSLGSDLKRYDAMRAMSGDGPFLRELLKSATAVISEYGASRQGEARDLFASLTHDIVRYAAMRSM